MVNIQRLIFQLTIFVSVNKKICLPYNEFIFLWQMSAAEACKVGLVTEVFPEATFQQEVHQRLQAMAKLPPKPLVYSKALIRDIHKEDLHKVGIFWGLLAKVNSR